MAKKEKKELTKEVGKITRKLLKLMSTSATFEVKEDEENEAVLVDVDSQSEAGLLIGNRGETVSSLQAILSMMVKQKTSEWHRVLVNVANWREKQEERLKDLANKAADKAKETGDPQPLYNLNASQRRIVHTILSEDKSVKTESFGEGEERYLLVSSAK
jgi:spoIIIJ-associated protein